MTKETAVATDAQKWQALQRIVGTYGLDQDLEDVAILLLVRGHDPQAVVDAVTEIHNYAGSVTEAARRVEEAEYELQAAQDVLQHEQACVHHASQYLSDLAHSEDVVEAEEEDVVELFSDEELAAGVEPQRRRY